jgi:hypothetical protein
MDKSTNNINITQEQSYCDDGPSMNDNAPYATTSYVNYPSNEALPNNGSSSDINGFNIVYPNATNEQPRPVPCFSHVPLQNIAQPVSLPTNPGLTHDMIYSDATIYSNADNFDNVPVLHTTALNDPSVAPPVNFPAQTQINDSGIIRFVVPAVFQIMIVIPVSSSNFNNLRG